MMKTEEQGRYEGYVGCRMYRVAHEDHGSVVVAAPSGPAAICAAAKLWNENWQELLFYEACRVAWLAGTGRCSVG